MATILAPMTDRRGKPTRRFAATHIATPAYVLPEIRQNYVSQYGKEVAERDYFPMIEVVKGNTPPAGEVFAYVSKGLRR